MTRAFDDFFSLNPSSLFEKILIPSFYIEADDKAVKVKAEMPRVEKITWK